jgi:hypothetical protein
MTIRGRAAIVGIGELPTQRSYPDQTWPKHVGSSQLLVMPIQPYALN